MIGVVCNVFLPMDAHVGLDLERVAELWPSSVQKLENMGIKDGTIVVTDDWRLLFVFPSGVELLWHENTRQWESFG